MEGTAWKIEHQSAMYAASWQEDSVAKQGENQKFDENSALPS